MIVRSAPEKNYSIVNNAMVEEHGLSFAAKGLLVYLLSKPAHWKVTDRHLATVGSDGRHAVQSMLHELEIAGYLVRERKRDEHGRFVWVSVVYDEPKSTLLESGNDPTMVRFSIHGLSSHGKPNHIVITDRVITDQAKDSSISSPPDGSEGADRALAAQADSHPAEPKPLPAAVAAPLTESPVAPPVQARKSKTRAAKRSAIPPAEAPAGAVAVAPSPPTAHQELFEAVCKAVGWDYKTLTADQQGQVAQTVGVLKTAGYGIEELRLFWRTVWVTDWRWRKYKQHPTIVQLRAEIGKVRVKELGTDERSTNDGIDELREQLKAKRRAANERRAGLAPGASPG